MSDVFREAPAPVIEALAYILLSKLYRAPIPALFRSRYRLYLSRKDVRQKLEQVRRERGRKEVADSSGSVYDLTVLFEDLNERYFDGLMARPAVGWSLRDSRSTLGHYDPSHHMIVLSRRLDDPEVPRLVVDYVMFHEMLHLRYPVVHKGTRRCVHTPEFKKAEKEFAGLAEARAILKRLG